MTLATPIHRLIRRVLMGAIEMRWSVAIGLALAHAFTTYVGFQALGEAVLVESPTQFLYFYVVTGSSVGYGDFSPTTDAGKLFAALWVIPGAISLFAFLVGKAVASITLTLRSIMHGLGDFTHKTGHVVVVGHVPGQTELLVSEAKRLHGRSDIVVVATHEAEGTGTSWTFVKTPSLSHREDLERAGISGASHIVVLGRDDDESLAAAMAVGALKPTGHVVAYFRERGPAEIVESYCPEIETVTSISVQMVARALVDPGAGDVLQALASTSVGATLYSTRLEAKDPVPIGTLRGALAARGASLVGYRPEGRETPILTLQEDTRISRGFTLYYIAETRLGDTFSPD